MYITTYLPILHTETPTSETNICFTPGVKSSAAQATVNAQRKFKSEHFQPNSFYYSFQWFLWPIKPHGTLQPFNDIAFQATLSNEAETICNTKVGLKSILLFFESLVKNNKFYRGFFETTEEHIFRDWSLSHLMKWTNGIPLVTPVDSVIRDDREYRMSNSINLQSYRTNPCN